MQHKFHCETLKVEQNSGNTSVAVGTYKCECFFLFLFHSCQKTITLKFTRQFGRSSAYRQRQVGSTQDVKVRKSLGVLFCRLCSASHSSVPSAGKSTTTCAVKCPIYTMFDKYLLIWLVCSLSHVFRNSH